MSSDKRVRYYSEFTDDFFDGEIKPLPENYKWVRDDMRSKIISKIVYAAAVVFGFFYGKFYLRLKVVGREKLKGYKKSGIFLFANHTQPVGDVFDPALVVFPKRIYTIASAANMSLPVIGKILPFLGALPLAGTVSGVKELSRAVKKRLSENACIVIYPEAHVWDWCTFIRPFPDSSFKFPIKENKPVFCATSVYTKSKFFKRPKMAVYIDGPFSADGEESVKAASKALRDTVLKTMTERSRLCDCEYVKYIRRENVKTDF